ncbi:MAG: formyltransferase family protein [Candidatus Riflebacteria bacterium]|jgi:methionyl-tRNA formyltransferase|nr:formyltransferase family protein [Candidatus Riflebacteria bacterium]
MTQEKILFLGPEDSPLIPWLQEQSEEVIQTSDRLSAREVSKQGYSFLVSYGYRHILRKDILDIFPGRAINLHISLLPWNRGADPNFWSFVEDTPKGVTIHYLDEGVDTGDIIAQQEIDFDSDRETLATSYEKLQATMQDLFKRNWLNIKNGNCQRQKQIGNGSTHKVKDKEGLSHLLTDLWNTPVSFLEEYAAETQISKQFWEKYDSEIEEIRKQKKA